MYFLGVFLLVWAQCNDRNSFDFLFQKHYVQNWCGLAFQGLSIQVEDFFHLKNVLLLFLQHFLETTPVERKITLDAHLCENISGGEHAIYENLIKLRA